MSLILKSDKISNNIIYNPNDVLDNPNFSAFFDFNSGYYAYRDAGAVKNVELSEAIVVSRATEATYKDKNNVTQLARVNEPRIHYMSQYNKSGLLIERDGKNLLLNPYAPVTQTVTIPSSAVNSTGLVLIVEGTGSATMSGGIGPVSIASATEGNPQYAYVDNPTTAATTITVTITGDVTFFQLLQRSYSTGGVYALERIPAGVVTVAADKASLTPLIGAKLSTAKTVIVQYLMKPRGETRGGHSYHLFTIVSPQKAGVGIYTNGNVGANRATQSITTKTVKDNVTNNATDRNTALATSVSDIVAVGITFDEGGLNMIQSSNGASNVITPAGTATTFNDILFGQDPSNPYLGGIMTRFVMYDYKMTRAELEAITTKWSTV